MFESDNFLLLNIHNIIITSIKTAKIDNKNRGTIAIATPVLDVGRSCTTCECILQECKVNDIIKLLPVYAHCLMLIHSDSLTSNVDIPSL